MSTPPLSKEILAQTLAAVARHGSQSAAADALGVPRKTFVHRLSVARRQQIPQEEYIAPDLIPEDEPIEDVWAVLESQQQRREAYRKAVDWMPFTVNGNEPFGLVFVGDPHLDQCDAIRFRSHIRTIEQTPRLWAVGLGDWINGWVGKLRGQYAFQSVTERNAVRVARSVLSLDIWWLILLGNHDGQRWHGDSGALRWMETAAMVPPQEWQVKFSIVCGERRWKIWAAHNFPGHSGFNANHGLDKRALHTGAEADLYVAGDRHTFKLSHDQHEHTGRQFWSARAKGYKPLDHYATEHGHGDQGGALATGHSITAIFDPRSGRLICFADVDEAASYLTWLRAR